MLAASWNPLSMNRWPWRRLALALGASLLAHYLAVDGWPIVGGGRPMVPAAPQLHAQLDVSAEPLTVPAVDTADLPQERPKTEWPRSVSVPDARPAQPAASAITEVQPAASSGSNIPDPRFYPARELDRYPLPLAPLDLRGMGGRPGHARVWVGIDLSGNVVDVALVDADPSGVLQRQLREQLLAVQFMPGIKDERPVRSRILLELVYGQ